MKLRWWLALASFACTAAEARTTSYAIAIGNNAPPVRNGAGLSVLRFADDDAVRTFQFFSRFTEEAWLLAVLDEQTQKRYPQAISAAQPPTLAALERAVRHIADRVKADLRRGDQPVVYVSFSGHGGRLPDGAAFLAFGDGELTRARLQQQILEPLSDAFVHLLVDACNAEDVVGTRGLFDQEVNAQVSAVSESDASRLTEAAGLGFPRVGILVAASASQESYEWSQIESGVFTHEILSGLAGAADANGDGLVEYGEMQAFLAAANRDVGDLRARLRVVAHAPPSNPKLPLVALEPLRDVAFLVGDFSRLEHFHIELENGERYLDAHLSSEVPGRIAFPANRHAFLVARDREAPLYAKASETQKVDSLHFRPSDGTARGSIESSLRSHLFASAFGPTYQKGFQDGRELARSSWDAAAGLPAQASYRKPLALGAWTLSGLSLVASVTTTVLAVKAKRDYEATNLQSVALAASDRFSRYQTAAIATGIGALAAGVTGWLLWPKGTGRVAMVPLPLEGGAAVALHIDLGESSP